MARKTEKQTTIRNAIIIFRDFYMAFLASFIQTAVKLVLMAAVAGCGLFFGKKLRDRKDEKTAAETLVQNEK